MQTIKIETYEFNELGREAKEKAMELMRDINVNYDGWYDMVTEEWKGKLTYLGFDNPEI